MTLDPTQVRVLGALVEKEITTPENYPLSLNSLLLACNQRSSRDPVLDLTEDQVRQAVHSLMEMGMVSSVRDARVAKYEHRIRTVLNLRRDETAIICLLFLRGPQTPGELRSRADRMFNFDDIAAVQSTLERLAARTPESDPSGVGPLVVQLARLPGSRESRYAHLLGGPVRPASTGLPPQSGSAEPPHLTVATESSLAAGINARLELLLDEVGQLKTRIARIEGLLDATNSKAVSQADPVPGSQ